MLWRLQRMKLSERSYPYSVVGNRDDVPNAAFQASVEMSADKESVYLDVKIDCSSSTINDYLKTGDVSYLLHVDCSNTFFRKSYKFSDKNFRQKIASENLNDLIEVNVFAIATKKINGYRVSESHPDYGNITFDVNEGNILAVAQTLTFYIDGQFDSMKRIGSIMQIVENPKTDIDLPMQVDFNGDKITILLSKSDFREYKLLKTNESIVGPLTATIVLPVLVEALNLLKSEFSNGEDDDSLKWVVVLKRRMKDLDIQGEENLEIAQKLLELPIRRALASTHALAESLGE